MRPPDQGLSVFLQVDVRCYEAEEPNKVTVRIQLQHARKRDDIKKIALEDIDIEPSTFDAWARPLVNDIRREILNVYPLRGRIKDIGAGRQAATIDIGYRSGAQREDVFRAYLRFQPNRQLGKIEVHSPRSLESGSYVNEDEGMVEGCYVELDLQEDGRGEVKVIVRTREGLEDILILRLDPHRPKSAFGLEPGKVGKFTRTAEGRPAESYTWTAPQ